MKEGFLNDLPDLNMPESHRKASDKNRKDIVRYVKMKCPRCGSPKVRIYSTRDLPVRHHHCLDCGHKFDSIEC